MVQVGVATELPESFSDLLQAPGVAVVGTIGPDGRPQMTAVWYLLDDDGLLKLTVRTDRQKAKNLAERPVATFFLVDSADPLRTLEVRATAEIEPDEGYVFADRLGAKYGTDLRTFDQPGDRRLVVTLRPERIIFRD
jgi:PPOX class probable F420-dependent enzyme